MYDPENETGTILILDANFTNATNLETEPCTSKQNEWSPLHVSTMWGITQTYHYFKTRSAVTPWMVKVGISSVSSI